MRTLGCGICEYGKGKRVYLDGQTSVMMDTDPYDGEWYLMSMYEDEDYCYDDSVAITVQYCPFCGRKLE